MTDVMEKICQREKCYTSFLEGYHQGLKDEVAKSDFDDPEDLGDYLKEKFDEFYNEEVTD